MQRLCAIDALPENNSKGFELEGYSLAVIRKQNNVYVYLNECPHRGVPLEWVPDQFLDVEKNFIQCATHGALFTLEAGECIAGPCPGEKLSAIPSEIKDGSLWVALP